MSHIHKITTFLILAISSQLVVAKDSIKVVFVGPSIGTETVLVSEDLKAWSRMLESSQQVEDPSLEYDRLTDSYTVDHHVGHGDTTVAINEYRYVPSRNESPGFVFFANVRGGWASSVGMWFRLEDGADQEMKVFLGLMKEN